ncbi:ABC transporter permease [Bacteroides reticulotermitis]|uniref:ABC transporter permease protein n=2 Tax=Bacteroides reticulotermitis TaxID=1133319 RepID=W4UW52_9BACE|nr:ABC transporter permease [Bacteroides reticulotermitis]MBB4046064.1 putative ABC transport system permease protein [Bacteroides reticulotermitis]GAE85435.1 ABC transporter permease protein [Bacteroides reticulotermitis JCM 10512]HJD76234.1 ABC transporter permease [Bacteroides reticulotermitis]
MFDIWQEIYSTIKRNKLRTFLTGFAVAWGIFMLIVLLGAGNGLIHAFEQSASERAMNSIKIFPGWTTKSYDGLKEGRRVQLDNKDFDATERYFPDNVIEAGATVRQSAVNVSFGAEYVNLSLTGVYPNHTKVEVVKLFKGRFINEIDIKERRKVIVLHKKTAEVLFDKTHTEPIGQVVNAGNVVYQVVGIYNDKGDSGDSDAFLPFTTLQTIYNKGDKLNNLVMTTKNLDNIESNEAFEARYRRVIGANHRFDPTDDSAIWIWNRFTNYLQQQKGTGLLRTAIWVIGIFTLLSGIVGVSNIMLITVKERTREFGIRKALGAKPLSILWLIIVESVTITTIFGYIGMVAGIGVTEWMNNAFGNQTMDNGIWSEVVFLNPTVDIRIAIQATVTLIIAGTLAGLVPARKAVSIRPIEALRAD